MLAVAMLAGAGIASAAEPKGQLVIRAGKADGTYSVLTMQLVTALNRPGSGLPKVAVEESQGSVQNVIDAAQNHSPAPNLAMFTAPPNVIAEAQRGDKPYGKNPRYRDIRGLFPIPFQTMHWVVRADSGVTSFGDLAGKAFIKGTPGSFSERQTVTLVAALGLDTKIHLIDIDSNAAPSALKNNQVIGFAIAGSYPIPALKDLAAELPLRLLALTPDQVQKELKSDGTTVPATIPKGTYPGIDQDIQTVALPAAIYTTKEMTNETAYRITKAFWTGRAMLAQSAPAWQAVIPDLLPWIGTRLHAGALRYYREAGIKVPAALR